MFSFRARSLCVIAMLCLALAACQKKADAPGSGGGAMPEGPAPVVLARLDGKDILESQVFSMPEMRQQLISLRNARIERELIDQELTAKGLIVTPEELAFAERAYYLQAGVMANPNMDAKTIFETVYLPQNGMTREQFDIMLLAQLKAQKVLVQTKPVDDAVMQTMLDNPQFPKDRVFAFFGKDFGWNSEADINLESGRPLWAQLVMVNWLQQEMPGVITELAKTARASGVITINRLPYEALPDDVAPAVDGVPVQSPALPAGETMNPVAYVLAGTEVTWAQLFEDEMLASELTPLWESVVQRDVIDLAWTESGLTLSDEELTAELEKIREEQGGVEEFAKVLAQGHTTFEEMTPVFRRFIQSERMVAAAYPVTEETIKAEYEKYTTEQWFQIFGPNSEVGMTLEGVASPADITLEKLHDEIKAKLEADNTGGPNRGKWMRDLVDDYLNNGRLELIDERAIKVFAPVESPEMAAGGGMPMPPPEAMPPSEGAPPAAPSTETAPPPAEGATGD